MPAVEKSIALPTAFAVAIVSKRVGKALASTAVKAALGFVGVGVTVYFVYDNWDEFKISLYRCFNPSAGTRHYIMQQIFEGVEQDDASGKFPLIGMAFDPGTGVMRIGLEEHGRKLKYDVGFFLPRESGKPGMLVADFAPGTAYPLKIYDHSRRDFVHVRETAPGFRDLMNRHVYHNYTGFIKKALSDLGSVISELL